MRCFFLIFPLLASPALSCTAGDLIFDCTLREGSRRVQVCRTGDALSYVYGGIGAAPEMVLATSVRRISYTPWNGVGRSIFEEMSFLNGAVAYTLWVSVDRQPAQEDAAPAVTAGIEVNEGDRVLARLDCDAGTVDAALDEIWSAKATEGQCYDRRLFAWSDC